MANSNSNSRLSKRFSATYPNMKKLVVLLPPEFFQGDREAGRHTDVARQKLNVTHGRHIQGKLGITSDLRRSAAVSQFFKKETMEHGQFKVTLKVKLLGIFGDYEHLEHASSFRGGCAQDAQIMRESHSELPTAPK